MSGALRIAAVLVVAAVATIAANVALLGVAAGPHDPVGQLSPLAYRTKLEPRRTAPPAPPAAAVREGERRADD